MNDNLVTALGVEIFQENANPFAARQHFKQVVVVADKDVLTLCELFFGTATYLHLVIPRQAGELAYKEAYKKAVEFGAYNRGLIYGVSIASDLSAFDSNFADGILVSTSSSEVMSSFMGHVGRVAKELSRVVVVTDKDLNEGFFGDKAVAGLKRVENFYCGTVRKVRTSIKKKPSRSRRKPVKPQ